VEAFEGNRAEATTMLPTVETFMATHNRSDVAIVADVGRSRPRNKNAIGAVGLSFPLGRRILVISYAVKPIAVWAPGWAATHPALARR